MLNFTTTDTWRHWQQRQRGVLRATKARLTPAAPALTWFSDEPLGDRVEVLVGIDAATPSQRAALRAPLEVLLEGSTPLAVLAPSQMESELSSLGFRSHAAFDPSDEVAAAAVLSVGDHLAAGAALHRIASKRGIPSFVVQHGILTPWSPPPPHGSTVLCWSAMDAAFLQSGRPDLSTEVVGSQLLFDAARLPAAPVESTVPTFLGQLHGAELPRATTIATVTALASNGPLQYRPHPAEIDRRSRRQHRRWRESGVELDRGSGPLHELGRPVVGIFSTGLLEAAASGLPAFAFGVGVPDWVHELWDRYEIAPLGSSAETRPSVPLVAPSCAIIDRLSAERS